MTTLEELKEIQELHYYTMSFGKYKGCVLYDVIERKPQYILWCINNVSWFINYSQTLKEKIREYVKNVCDNSESPYDRPMEYFGEDFGWFQEINV